MAPPTEQELQAAVQSEAGFLITGGGGYVGQRLCQRLLRLGARTVHLLDVRKERLPKGCTSKELSRVQYFEGDLRLPADIERAMTGTSVVMHVGSFGMSGREQLNSNKIFDINVTGTGHVLDTCQKLGVDRLVYTSTTNVVFGSWPIENGDESLPYLPLDLHCDNYSKSKSMAEQLVLGRSNPSLRTCALRAAGIYGEGEERHLPRIVAYLRAGLFRFVIGTESNKCEFIHVDNLVFAHILAFMALRPGGQACGRAYFVSDGCPFNNWLFFKPIIEGLGYPYPSLRIPYLLAFYVAMCIEAIHRVVSPIYNFQPLLTRAEVNKTGVTHYFKLDNARRDLGYEPVISMDEGLRRTIDYLCKEEARQPPKSKHLPILILLLVMVTLFMWLGLGPRGSS